nr:DUF3365 domain-containing protein [Bacteroidota bacterium]
MKTPLKFTKDPLKIREYAIYSTILWTLLLAVLLVLDINLIKREALKRAYTYTKVGFDKDVIYRRWASEHGGVYVKVDSNTPPNPYLSNIEDRDIIVDSNLHLTLMNPAYMTRQVYELQNAYYQVHGHITSLNPIRPENTPDTWEVKALISFENGEPEFSGVDTLNGKAYFRYMKPVITEKSCLKCHAQQGYKLNDIRGGISISYPFDQIYILSTGDIRNLYFMYVIIWLFGIGIIAFSYLRLKKGNIKRLVAEDALRILNDQLEQKVEQRSRELQKSQRDWENIFNTIGFPAQLIGADYTIKNINDETLSSFNLKRKDIIGKKCFFLFHHADSPAQNCPFQKVLLENKSGSEEFYIERLKKSYIVNCSPIYNDKDEIESFMHIMTDISDRKEIELKFQTLIEQAGDAIYLSDFDGNIMEVNRQAIKEMGYTREEFLQMKVWELDKVYPDLAAVRTLWDTMKPNEAMTFETTYKRKDGSFYPVELRAGLTEITGKKTILGFARNISERRKVEEELKKYHENLELLVRERTKEIEEKNAALERINKLFVGRELRMAELKEEIEKLKGTATSSV